jgi:hypothetical protein
MLAIKVFAAFLAAFGYVKRCFLLLLRRFLLLSTLTHLVTLPTAEFAIRYMKIAGLQRFSRSFKR